jgi:hypothetical protein
MEVRCQITALLLQTLLMELTVQGRKQSNYQPLLILILILIPFYTILLILITLYPSHKAAMTSLFQAYRPIRLLPFIPLYSPKKAAMISLYHRVHNQIGRSAQGVKWGVPFFGVTNVSRHSRNRIS